MLVFAANNSDSFIQNLVTTKMGYLVFDWRLSCKQYWLIQKFDEMEK